MSKKSEEKSTGDKILQSALKEFAEYGFAGSRVDRIAKRAKVNKAMIYYHYKSKEALYETTLKNLYSVLLANITKAVSDDSDPLNQLYSLVHSYTALLAEIDDDMIRTMLREVASGGKYFRKLTIPNLIKPVLVLVLPIFEKAREQGKIRDVNALYTFFQILGSIIFFNIIRISTFGTDINRMIFGDSHTEEFRENLLKILKYGIETQGAHNEKSD